MIKTLLAPIMAVSLACSGCAINRVLTPERCQSALSAGRSASDFLSIIRGLFPLIEPERAQKLAEALALSQLTLQAVCDQVNSGE